MKKTFTILFLTFFSFLLNAYAQDSTVQYIGPGAILHKVVKPSVPWNISILEFDLTNPYISIETEVAHDKLGNGLEKPTSMALRNDSPGHTVLGAINGDYFGISAPTNPYTFLSNSQIKDEEYVFGRTHQRSSFGYDINKKPFVEILNFSGTVTASNGNSLDIFGVNRERGTNQLLVYNKYFSPTTLTNEFGTEIRLNSIDPVLINVPIRFIAEAKENSIGSMAINGKYVLSGNEAAATFLNSNISIGDTVTLFLGSEPERGRLAGLMGGGPRMIIDGQKPDNFDGFEGFGGTHTGSRHPRTAVGFGADSTKLYLLVVDGRQSSLSVGMTIKELAEYMKSIGCTDAVNLDGGGSSVLVARNQIISSPSDPGGERSVGNALIVISSALQGALSILHISPPAPRIFLYQQMSFTVQGTDDNYNPVHLNSSLIQWQLSKQSLGTITSAGNFTAASTADSGYVIVRYQNLADSVFIVVKGVKDIELKPKQAVTDNTRIVVFKATVFDTDNIVQNINPVQLQWALSDSSVGTLDVLGQFKGKKQGTTKVYVSFMNAADTAEVRVEIGQGKNVIDSLENLEGWNYELENLDSASLRLSSLYSSIGNFSFQIDYSFVYQPNIYNWIYIKNDIPTFGLPDSMYLDVRSDGRFHRLFFDLEDAMGVSYRLNTNKFATDSTGFETLKARIPSSTNVVFPLALKKIAIAFGNGGTAGQNYFGTIYIDNLMISYPPTTIDVKSANPSPEQFTLYQNYPNPFNPTTNIRFVINGEDNISLTVFDIFGQKVETLINGRLSRGVHEVKFNAAGYASGIYFYRLITGASSETKKLVVMK